MNQEIHMTKLLTQLKNDLHKTRRDYEEKIRKFERPKILSLDKEYLGEVHTVVAVDGSNSGVGKKLSKLGIYFITAADSRKKHSGFSSIQVVYLPEFLNHSEWEQHVDDQLDRIEVNNHKVHRLISDAGFDNLRDIPTQDIRKSPTKLIGFIRDIVEWAELYDLALKIKKRNEEFPTESEVVLLRDGSLLFTPRGEKFAKPVGELFEKTDVPIIGVSKRSKLLGELAVRKWLNKYIGRKNGSFLIEIPDDENSYLRKVYSDFLERYEEGFLVGEAKLYIVRFDPVPGNENYLLLNIPKYVRKDRERMISILNSIKKQCATVYPKPGIPWPIYRAHEKAAIYRSSEKILEHLVETSLDVETLKLIKELIKMEDMGI